MRTRLLVILHVALGAAVAACTRGRDIAGVDDSTFVRTMAKLQAIEANPALDSAARAAARRAALQERGLAPDDLERAARALAADPERAIKVWSRIDTATQRLTRPATR